MDAKNDRGGSLAYVYLLTLVAALGGLLFGYDTAVISGAIGFLRDPFPPGVRLEGMDGILRPGRAAPWGPRWPAC